MIWYRVQVGAYIFKTNAEKVCKDLLKKGFNCAMPREKGLYRVRIGSFQSKKNAESILKEVKQYPDYKNTKIIEWDDGKNEPAAEKVRVSMAKYVGSKTAHRDILRDYNKIRAERGKKPLGMDAAYCSMTIVASFYNAGYMDLIGFARTSSDLKANAQKKGTWISGKPDKYRLGDIIIYQGSDGKPNHSEFSVNDIWNYSGNYGKYGCDKRKKKDRHSKVHGVIRPKYDSVK